MRRVLLAFQLTGFRPGGEGHSRVWTEPGPSLHGGTGTLLLPRSCRERRRVAREDLVRVVELAHRIPDSAFMPINRRDVALHRFLRGCAEEIPGEALIDFVIALEAMFLPSHLRNGKGRVLRDRGAEFGGANPTERGNITALLKEAYDVRSLIVHGLAPPAADRVASAYEGVRQFTASVLVKALSEGWPDAEGSTTKTT